MNTFVRLSLIVVALVAVVAVMSSSLSAQRPESSRAVPPGADSGVTEIKPPITAKRAFLSSLLLPGYGQSMLGRKRSGAMMLAVEALSVAMLRESSLSLREARRNVADSIVLSYVDASGAPLVTWVRPGFSPGLIRVRKEHVEDWAAMIVATHLFSGVDALVAALLWDLPAEIQVSGNRNTTNLGFRVRF